MRQAQTRKETILRKPKIGNNFLQLAVKAEFPFKNNQQLKLTQITKEY